ncbi:MAG: c-type cytochrome biogenesis protein CcmI [bacterium]
MIGFWISAGAMLLMVALVLSQALRQAATAAMADPAAADLAVYRDQLAEVDRDLARGTIPPPEADRLRLEVQRRMLDADRAIPVAPRPVERRTTLAVSVVVALALLAAVGLYWSLGVPGYPDLPLSERYAAADEAYQNRPSQTEAEAAEPPYVQPKDVDPDTLAMIEKLRAAVATRPDDELGHTLLAQNEASLGNYIAARKAQEVVIRIKGDKVSGQDLGFLANLMVYAAGGIVTPEAEQVLIRCLKVDPTNGWARFYSGLMFAEIGRPDRTFTLWEPLLREGPADAPWLPAIRSQITDVASAAGINYTLSDTSPGPSAADVANAAQMSDADRQSMIQTMVAGLEDRLNRDGGSLEDWAKLIKALGVLKETDRATAAYDKAQAAFAGQPGELSALHSAAVDAGIAE